MLPLFEEELSSTQNNNPVLSYSSSTPLAYFLAPQKWEDYVGQTHLIGPNKPLRRLIDSGRLSSMLLWGPTGCGKTSLVRLLAHLSQALFVPLNAVTANIADIRNVIQTASKNRQKTLLFVDEIHRFSKVQQEALLEDVEKGTLIFIGATTENPYFSVASGLLSRSHVFELFALTQEELYFVLERALNSLEAPLELNDESKLHLIKKSQGDARKLISFIEMLQNTNETITLEQVEQLTQSKGQSYTDESHYNLTSAFIKSMRASQTQAAVYWLARLLHAGDDPRFIARRLVIFASEDIGNADPQAFIMASALLQASERIGLPEIRINLSQVTTYLSEAPKSNRAYKAINAAQSLIEEGTLYNVPEHLKNKPQSGYIYPHDNPEGAKTQNYLPGEHIFY